MDNFIRIILIEYLIHIVFFYQLYFFNLEQF